MPADEHKGGEAETRKVYVRTFGCQMNVYDSERITEGLALKGYTETTNLADADVVVLNTCHIREKAADKVYSDLGRIKDIKVERAALGKKTVVTVAGCVAQAEGAEIQRRVPAVDLVIGPQSYHKLPDLVAKIQVDAKRRMETEFPEDEKFRHLPERMAPKTFTAFLTVQEGCDKFCTFCVVPYTRGAEYSRSVADIEKEARRLVSGGVRELTLLGQNVNAYHGVGPDGASWSLAQLVRHLAKIPELARLRYTTSHPRDMADDLIAAHAEEPKLMPFLHLPVQSGSDRILAAMNRRHTVEDFRGIVARVRAAQPGLALSSDFIVGFPGETEAEFEATMALVEEMGFAQSYSFKYSARPGTPASDLDGQLPEGQKTERLVRLQALLWAKQTAFNQSCVGTSFPVLFEKLGRNAGQLIGRSPFLQSVHAEAGRELLGKLVTVRIVSASQNSLKGTVAVS
jgi:tRNA-2-methylthio-N6-dimethylallyladenosine synthase